MSNTDSISALLAAVVIAEMAEEPSADRPGDEAEGEQERRVQLLDDGVVAGKEGAGEVERERGVGVEVVPLDEIPDRSDENGANAPADIGAGLHLGHGIDVVHGPTF